MPVCPGREQLKRQTVAKREAFEQMQLLVVQQMRVGTDLANECAAGNPIVFRTRE
jgi:hypothetical protein